MITPSNRTLIWTTIVVLPWAAAGYLFPWHFLAGASGFFLVLVLFDSALGYLGLKLTVSFPETVLLMKGREGAIEFFAQAERTKTATARIGLSFPPEIVPHEDYLTVRVKGGPARPVKLYCTALKRGTYLFDRCYVETSSPLGFWTVRRCVTMRLETRVYPDLLEERRGLSALFLPRGMFGIRPQRTMGQGREFEKLREYIRGDSYDQIHWKVTAKRGHPVTKVYQIERTQEVYVVVDSSRLSARDSGEKAAGPGETMLDRFISGALILGLAARRQGDLFGLLAYNDRVGSFFRAKAGHSHFISCRDALYALQPKVVTPDFGELFAFIRTKIRKRALIVFLTALDDPVLAESFIRNAELINRRHLILVGMIKPESAGPLFSGLGVSSVESIYRGLGRHLYWHGLLELEKELGRKGMQFSLAKSENFCPALVSRYMRIKSRQLI